jgi:hypothetical protein
MSRVGALVGLWAIAALATLVSGCGGAAPPPVVMPPVHADDGGNVALPEGFPADAPRYPGARLAASSSIHPAVSITQETDDPQAKAAHFYLAQLPQQGWVIEQQKDAEGTLLVHTRKGGQPLTVEINTENGKTRIVLKYTPKE